MKKTILALLLIISSISLLSAADEIIFEEGYIKEGIALHEKGEYKEAIKLYDMVLKQNPKNEFALYEKAFSLIYLGKSRAAMRIARKLIKSEDDKVVELAYTMYGNILDDIGQNRKSVKVYREALLKFPKNYLLNYNLAISYAAQGEYKLSRRYLLESLNYYPIHLNSLYSLSRIENELKSSLGTILPGLFFLFYSEESDKRADEIRKILLNLYKKFEQKELEMVFDDSVAFELATNMILKTTVLDIKENRPEERESLLRTATAQLLTLYAQQSATEFADDELPPWVVESFMIIKHIIDGELTESFLDKIVGKEVEKESLQAMYDIVKAFYR